MATVQNHHILAATLALLLSTTGIAAATTETNPPAAGAKASSDAELNARIPLPAPLNIPPPSAKDVAVPGATPAPQPAAKDATTTPATEVAVPADPVAEKLRELITTKLSRFVDRKSDRTGIEAFYAARQYAPLWTDKGIATDKASAAIAYLAGVEAEGLTPADYPTRPFKSGADALALAEAEVMLTDSVITFARHAQIGRVHFSRVAGDIFYTQVTPEPNDVLAAMAKASDVRQALDAYNPPHAAYKALKAKLAEARAMPVEAPAPTVRIPEGPMMRPGMNDPRVPLVRTRLNVAGDKADTKYDDQVSEAVKSFQLSSGLEADGVLGPNTQRILNNGPRRVDVVSTILANMERWRWLPRDLGKAHVVLNIPNFTLKVFNNGATVWETKVVVGKPDTATPILSETMKYITVNPTWNVPPSIVYNEYLPALQQDPTALTKIGVKVTQNEDGSLHMFQPPGDGNALGRIRFNFPNKFLVYQHDTPDKHLFARDTRAYSHGCMRVQDPLKYGEVLLSIVLPKEGYTQERLRSMYGNEEKEIPFPVHIPVHITYQTAFVDDAGKLIIREDIYGRDARTLAPLKDDRQNADVPMDRRGELQASYARPPVNLPYGVVTEGSSSRYAYSDGGNFFEMLFGGGRPRPPAPVNNRRNYGRN